jgi:hypothetical protein
MNVALWAEIRRLAEIEKLSGRVIARRLRCSWRTVAAALERDDPPARPSRVRTSVLDPHKTKINALLARYPELSAVRIHEEIARGPDGYTGSVITVRRHVRSIRPASGRVYQEVHCEPAFAMQVDWGECGRVTIGNTTRKVSPWWPCFATAGSPTSSSPSPSARRNSIGAWRTPWSSLGPVLAPSSSTT